MTGHRPFGELTVAYAPERRARVAARAAVLRQDMTLAALRRACNLSQEALAEAMSVGQPAVADMEDRTADHIANLRRYVEALGGQLEITVRFPRASVVIRNLGDPAG